MFHANNIDKIVTLYIYIYIYTCINNINNNATSADILQDKDNFVFSVENIFAVKC